MSIRFRNIVAIAAGVPLMLVALQGCGGGSGGSSGTKTLTVAFDYPKKITNLWQPAALDITATGLEGYTPVCTVITGALPKGLAIDPDSCRISGTPTEATVLSPTIRLTVPGATGQVDKQFQFIAQGPSADYAGLTGAVHFGIAYTYSTIGADAISPAWAPLPGQTLAYSVTSGTLPHGLVLDPGSGKLSGVPDQEGTYQFTIQATATSGANVVTSPARSYSLTASLPGIAVSYPALPEKKVGDTLSIQPSIFYPSDAPADKVSLEFQLYPGDTLPPGLSLDPKTGIVAGTLTGPVPGQNPGQATSWPYDIRIVVNVTFGSLSYTLLPAPYILLAVSP